MVSFIKIGVAVIVLIVAYFFVFKTSWLFKKILFFIAIVGAIVFVIIKFLGYVKKNMERY